MANPRIELHKGDLPAGLDLGPSVAVDTEALGLKPQRDRLCLVQLSAGDNTAHLIQFTRGDYSAPRLKALLTDPAVLKIFHFARFDIAILKAYLGVTTAPLSAMAVCKCSMATDSGSCTWTGADSWLCRPTRE